MRGANYSTTFDEISDELGKLSIEAWVDKRSSQLGEDRELQLALDPRP